MPASAERARSSDAPDASYWILLLLAGLFALFVVHTISFWHYVNDDAYITLRYGANLASGVGPYYNVGEYVEGYTNTLMVFFAAAIIQAGGVAWGPTGLKLVSLGFGLLSVTGSFALVFVVLRRFLRRYEALFWASLAAALVAVHPSFALNAVSGLETSMFAAWIVVGCFLAYEETVERRWRGSGVAFALALLTRPEGIAFFGVHWLTSLAQTVFKKDSASLKRAGLRNAWANAGVVGVTLGGLLLFRYFTYEGEWLPNTYYAKVSGYWAPADVYVMEGLGPSLLWGGGLVLAGMAVMWKARSAWTLLPIFATAFFGVSLPFIVGTDWMPGFRFVMHSLPLVVSASVIGVAIGVSMRWQLTHRSGVLALIFVLLVGLAWISQLPHAQALSRETRIRAEGFQTGHLALAETLCSENPPGMIALMDIGMIGYRCAQTNILDITGLTNRHIAKAPGAFLDKEYAPTYVLDQKPDFIVLTMTSPGTSYEKPDPDTNWEPWTPIEFALLSDPTFKRHYTKATRYTGPAIWRRLATTLGARYAFEAGYPEAYYVQLVFEKHEGEEGERDRETSSDVLEEPVEALPDS